MQEHPPAHQGIGPLAVAVGAGQAQHAGEEHPERAQQAEDDKDGEQGFHGPDLDRRRKSAMPAGRIPVCLANPRAAALQHANRDTGAGYPRRSTATASSAMTAQSPKPSR